MFCEKCGAPVAEGMAFCTACGASLTPSETPVAETPVAETPVAEAPVAETVYAEQATFVPAPKKRFKLIKVLVPVVAVVAAASVAFAAFGAQIINGAKKLIMDENAYYASVEYKAIENMLFGDKLGSFNFDSYSVKSTETIEIADELKSILKQAGVDLDQYITGGKISLDYSLIGSKDIAKVAAALSLNDTELIGMEYIYDLLNMTMYGKIPFISEDSVKIDMSELYKQSDMSNQQLESVELVSTVLSDLLNDEKLMNELESTVKEYLRFMLKNSFDFKESTDKVEVDDVSASYTKLSAKISAEDCAKMLSAALEKLSKDKNAKKLIVEKLAYNKIIEPLADAVPELDGYDLDELNEEFDEALEDAIDELDSVDYDETLATYTVWVNSKGDIVGREIEVEDEVTARYLTVEKGGKQAFELAVEGYGKEIVCLKGSAKKSFGVLKNGEYTLSISEQDAAVIELERYDAKAAENGKLDIKCRIAMDEDLFELFIVELDDLPDGIASFIKAPAIELEAKADDKSASLIMTALLGDKPLFTLTSSTTVGEGETVAPPTDAVELEEYAQNLSDMDKLEELLNKLFDKLESAGVKSDVIDMLKAYYEAKTTPSYDYGYDSGYDYGYGYDYGTGTVTPDYNYYY